MWDIEEKRRARRVVERGVNVGVQLMPHGSDVAHRSATYLGVVGRRANDGNLLQCLGGERQDGILVFKKDDGLLRCLQGQLPVTRRREDIGAQARPRDIGRRVKGANTEACLENTRESGGNGVLGDVVVGDGFTKEAAIHSAVVLVASCVDRIRDGVRAVGRVMMPLENVTDCPLVTDNEALVAPGLANGSGKKVPGCGVQKTSKMKWMKRARCRKK